MATPPKKRPNVATLLTKAQTPLASRMPDSKLGLDFDREADGLYIS
jgi:hypothetical protein